MLRHLCLLSACLAGDSGFLYSPLLSLIAAIGAEIRGSQERDTTLYSCAMQQSRINYKGPYNKSTWQRKSLEVLYDILTLLVI
jgi:hypothetical protein